MCAWLSNGWLLAFMLQGRISLLALLPTCHFEWGNDCHLDSATLVALQPLNEDNTVKINKAVLNPITALLDTFNTASAFFKYGHTHTVAELMHTELMQPFFCSRTAHIR